MDIYRRVGNLSTSNENKKALLWDLQYCTKGIINCVIDPVDRDTMRRAYQSVYGMECLKLISNPNNYKSVGELIKALPEKDLLEAGIEACFVIIGETRTYFDRYFGFETKLEVMRRVVGNPDDVGISTGSN
jgi:hypothetical protein